MTPEPDIDPARFDVHRYEGRGFSQAYVREGEGGVPLLLRARLAGDASGSGGA